MIYPYRNINLLKEGQKFKFRTGGITYVFAYKKFGQIGYWNSKTGKFARKKFDRNKSVLISW